MGMISICERENPYLSLLCLQPCRGFFTSCRSHLSSGRQAPSCSEDRCNQAFSSTAALLAYSSDHMKLLW